MTNCVARGARAAAVLVHSLIAHTCIMYLLCSVASSAALDVDTSSRTIYQKKLSTVQSELLGEVCKFSDLSCCDGRRVKSGKVEVSVNFGLLEQVNAGKDTAAAPAPPDQSTS